MTPILIRHVVRTTLALLAAAILVVGFVLGFDQSLGVVIGCVLAGLDGLGLIYLVGRLLEPAPASERPGSDGATTPLNGASAPGTGAPSTGGAERRRELPKAALFALIFVKLLVIGGLLWAALRALPGSGLGIVIGIGVAVGAMVIGVSQGSTSIEGQRAMDAAEQKIRAEEERARQEGRDKDADSG